MLKSVWSDVLVKFVTAEYVTHHSWLQRRCLLRASHAVHQPLICMPGKEALSQVPSSKVPHPAVQCPKLPLTPSVQRRRASSALTGVQLGPCPTLYAAELSTASLKLLEAESELSSSCLD